MQRGIRILVLISALLMAFGLFSMALRTAFICYDNCPPESELAATLAQRITDATPTTLLFAAPMVLAWMLCLVQLARAGRRWTAVALAAALPVTAALALGYWSVSTRGHLLPTTWLAHNTGWNGIFDSSLALLLLWPVATFVATFALRQR
jgi:hypothetical protein